MSIKEYSVEVTTYLTVKIDEDVISDEFNEVFSDGIFPADCSEDHAEHLAEMETRGLIGFDRFVEGYGDLMDLSCSVKVDDISVVLT